MANLAIRGHAKRGKEVIEILKMFGGKNDNHYVYGSNDDLYYYIATDGYIYGSGIKYEDFACQYCIFTLEEFLEKFPYKVGDKVIAYAEGCVALFKIQDMRWNDELNKVEYKICSSWLDTGVIFTSSYKEETMEKEKKDYEEWFQTDYLDFENNDDTWADEVEVNLGKDYEIQIRGDKTFIVKKKPQYPKSYEECCEVLMGKTDFHDFELVLTKFSITRYEENRISPEPPYITLINNYYKLLICRDAYWKIAGDWKEKRKEKAMHYVICSTLLGEVVKDTMPNCIANYLLDFPTAEMRDIFFENFKDLIELCKEFL